MRVGRPAQSGEAHRKHARFAAPPAGEDGEASDSDASVRTRPRERARARQGAAARERAGTLNARSATGTAAATIGGRDARGRRSSAFARRRGGGGTSSGEEGTSSDESSVAYDDVERGRRHARTSARARAGSRRRAGRLGKLESRIFGNRIGGAAAAAATASGARRGGGGGTVRPPPATNDFVGRFGARGGHRVPRRARRPRGAVEERRRSLPRHFFARDRARWRLIRRRRRGDAPKPPRDENGAAPPIESPVRAQMRAHANGRRNRSPAPVYELSSSDEEFWSLLGRTSRRTRSRRRGHRCCLPLSLERAGASWVPRPSPRRSRCGKEPSWGVARRKVGSDIGRDGVSTTTVLAKVPVRYSRCGFFSDDRHRRRG